ncbi:hypothetical protein BDK51DRAFT_29445 [Blyttiomyces helicus]|uniref:Uncharacterized protein n=1 Tax=Blyttiomyces helicus TaxID=388810 RepID=A0A4P9WIY0_9FUNG|nr:hypothetical protein BDK51DRAFT_29445 [Blyttiomyces helicus]|eukprot:RKO92859.1 hypothetical protein BDK51DRAFT_29445 [Blyttiomyces helicus]
MSQSVCRKDKKGKGDFWMSLRSLPGVMVSSARELVETLLTKEFPVIVRKMRNLEATSTGILGLSCILAKLYKCRNRVWPLIELILLRVSNLDEDSLLQELALNPVHRESLDNAPGSRQFGYFTKTYHHNSCKGSALPSSLAMAHAFLWLRGIKAAVLAISVFDWVGENRRGSDLSSYMGCV